ncbi:MAG: hypothetical protein ACRDZQ_10205, partial [Acidimicrobiales bacterium]
MRDAALLSRADAGGEPGPAPVRGGAAVGRWLAPLVVVVLVGATHIWLASHMRAPVVQADEFGYLYGAHFLALGGPHPATANYAASPYYPGYSLLLVPLWWLSRSTATVYRWALLENVVLAALTAWLAYLLAGRLAPRLGPWVRALVALVVAAYPSYLLFANIAESENLLVPAVLGICLLARRAFASREPWTWAALGLAGGLLYAVHPSALAVTVAVAAVGAWVARPWRGHLRLPGALGAGLVVGLALARALIGYVTAGGPTDTGGFLSALGRGLGPGGLSRLGVDAAGQLLYLLAASAGLVVLGSAMAAKATWMVAARREGRLGISGGPGAPQGAGTRATAAGGAAAGPCAGGGAA